MFNGRIIRKSATRVEGSHRAGGWSDNWDESYDIEYDGEFTEEVCEAVIKAFCGSSLHVDRDGSSYGALRWPLRDSNIRVDTEARKLIVTRGTGMCD